MLPSSGSPPAAPQRATAARALHAARKELGLTDTKNKRLSADALRTMESVYQRTPFPSRDVIK